MKVRHIIVCGHYDCGGVRAALEGATFGVIDNWLRNIQDVYRLHQADLDSIKDKDKRMRRLVELNVTEQVILILFLFFKKKNKNKIKLKIFF